MSLRSAIVAQFRKPRGVLGRLAGAIMAIRGSNRQRNFWTVDLLGLEPHHRVLEFGCGPGIALQASAGHLRDGMVLGIDHSDVMVGQARRRLAVEIGEGRAEVRIGTLDDVVATGETFDRIFSANVIQFLPDMDAAFAQIRALLLEGGMVATTYQPRSAHPTRGQALDMAERIEQAMAGAGFTEIARHELPLDPVPAICVTGTRG